MRPPFFHDDSAVRTNSGKGMSLGSGASSGSSHVRGAGGNADACLFKRLQNLVQTQQRSTFFGLVADEREARNEITVVVERTGTGKEKPRLDRVYLVERNGIQIIEPVKDPAAESLVVGVVAWVIR